MANRIGLLTRSVTVAARRCKLALTSEIRDQLGWPHGPRTVSALVAARRLGLVESEHDGGAHGELTWWITPTGEAAIEAGFPYRLNKRENHRR